MAEASLSLSVTPEITKPDGVNSRRNSFGKASSEYSGEKILPHYLRASTGSCHDFCKYGREHAFETKARRLIPKRTITKPPEDQNLVEITVLSQKKKTSMVKLKPPSVNSRNHVDDTADIIKQEVSPKLPDTQNPGESVVLAEKKKRNKTSIVKPKPSRDSSNTPNSIKQEISSSSEKVQVSSEKSSSKAKEMKLSTKRATSLKLNSELVKPASAPDSLGGLSSRRNSNLKIGKRTGTSKVAVKKVLALPESSLSPKPSLSRVASLNVRKRRSLKVVSPLDNEEKIKKAEPEQPEIEVKQANKKAEPEQPEIEVKQAIKKVEPEQPEIEVRQANIDTVPEKTLYIITMETENKLVESDQAESCVVQSSPPPSSPFPTSPSLPNSPYSSSHKEEDEEESEYTVTEAEDDSLSEDNETVSMEEMETLEGEHEGRPRKASIVCSEDKDGQPVKLHFRRGKVVGVQSDNDGPRRLKFRRGRVLGENQNVKADARKSFNKRGVDGDTNDSKHGSVKVVLRHQDVQGKKDAQGLFNNVIEETASKLVETRKSKVKALVGAFETVISLQESKPSANTVT